MTTETPPFWHQPPGWQAWALSPVSWVYGRAAAWRMNHGALKPVSAPVLCVGNFTVGGSGKTPAAIALAKAAAAQGLKPGFLSRGHGGVVAKPHIIDPLHDSARHAGDEPMLLAEAAPVAVSPDRAAAAELLIGEGCDFLIMDDGFQSRKIAIDHALVVVDARRGVGNGHVIPGGPVRAPILTQMRHVSSLLVMGEGAAADGMIRRAARAGRPVFHARVEPLEPGRFADRKFVAFAGIGEPEKFYDTLEKTGAWISATRNFADHHSFTDEDLTELNALAAAHDATLVTTAKDAVRLRDGNALARETRERTEVLEIATRFDDASAPGRIIADTLERYRARSLR